jgi:hypothetical protein
MRGMSVAPCEHVRHLCDYELAHGNTIASVVARPEYEFVVAVVFNDYLKIWGTPATATVPAAGGLKYWDSGDDVPDGEFEAGYQCKKCRHAVMAITPD